MKESTRFDAVQLPEDLRRQLDVLKVSLVLATPKDPKESEELTQIVSRMRSTYGKGKWCPDPAKPEACQKVIDLARLTHRADDATFRAKIDSLLAVDQFLRYVAATSAT